MNEDETNVALPRNCGFTFLISALLFLDFKFINFSATNFNITKIKKAAGNLPKPQA